MKKIILATVFMMAVVYNSSAIIYSWNNYLNSENVSSMADGGTHLWMGTSGGLVKFDKSNGNCTFYNKANSGIPYNSGISSVVVDQNGVVWIGFLQGFITRFDGVNWTTYTYPTFAGYTFTNSWDIRQLYVDSSDNLWICTGNQAGNPGFIYGSSGVTRFDGLNWTNFGSLNSGLSNNYVTSITQDHSGNMWFGTFNGLYKYDGTNWTNYPQSVSTIPNHNVYGVDVNVNGDLLVVTHHISVQNIFDYSVLTEYDGINWNSVDLSTEPSQQNILMAQLTHDSLGTIWFARDSTMGTAGKRLSGLASYDGSVFTTYNVADGFLANDEVHSLLPDQSGIIWTGTTNGLEQKSGNVFNKYYVSNLTGVDINAFTVNCMTEDANGVRFIGTTNGLLTFDGSSWTVFNSDNSPLRTNNITALAIDTNGLLWVAADSSNPYVFPPVSNISLSVYDGINWTIYDQNNSPSLQYPITSIVIDGQNRPWFMSGNYGISMSSQAYLTKFDGLYFTVDSSKVVQCPDLVIDSLNHLWICSRDTLYEYNGFVWIPHVTSLTITYGFSSMALDDSGSFWMGGSHPADPDLYEFDGTNWTAHPTGSGFNIVTRVAAAHDGSIWGAATGLFQYDGNQFTFFRDNSPLASLAIQNIHCFKDGSVWCGHTNGLTEITLRDDSVWPGDCNYDGVANNTDILFLGLAFGDSGPVRASASLNWTAQYCQPWLQNYFNGINHKHADTDGDGQAGFSDTTAILLNYSQSHPLRMREPASIQTVNPFITLIATADTIGLNQVAVFDIVIGGPLVSVDSLYGIAFTIHYESSLVDSTANLVYTDSWFVNTPDFVSLSKNFYQSGTLDGALCRTTGTNAFGHGFIGSVQFVSGSLITLPEILHVWISDVKAITANGDYIPIDAQGDSMLIDPLFTGIPQVIATGEIKLYPNPATDRIRIESKEVRLDRIEIYDSQNRLVKIIKEVRSPFEVSTIGLESGMYFCRVISGTQSFRKAFIKE